MENNTAKHFVLQLGSLITLYLSLSFLLVLLFSIINLIYPDATEAYYQIESSNSGIRLGIAMVMVFFPTYLYLTRKVNNFRRKESGNDYLGLTKWLMYLSLLVGGIALLVDLVIIINYFLEGELTTRFLLKAGLFLALVGSIFYYYYKDTNGYWLKREKGSLYYGAGISLVVLVSLVTGFIYAESPTQVREGKLDETQVQDLREIQWKVEEALNVSSSTLPATLEDLYQGFAIPEAPEARDAYSYEVTDGGFNLCATFSRNSSDVENGIAYKPYTEPGAIIVNSENWSYKAGRYCFERTVR